MWWDKYLCWNLYLYYMNLKIPHNLILHWILLQSTIVHILLSGIWRNKITKEWSMGGLFVTSKKNTTPFLKQTLLESVTCLFLISHFLFLNISQFVEGMAILYFFLGNQFHSLTLYFVTHYIYLFKILKNTCSYLPLRSNVCFI